MVKTDNFFAINYGKKSGGSYGILLDFEVNRWVTKAREEGLPQESVRKIVDIVRILMDTTKAIQHEFLEAHSKLVGKINPPGKTDGSILKKREGFYFSPPKEVNYVAGNRS